MHHVPHQNLPSRLARIVLLAICLIAPRGVFAGDDFERWYTVEMGTSQAGWLYQSQKTEGDLITSTSRMEFSLSRDQTGAKITMEGSFVETKAGKPVSMETSMKFGLQPTSLKAKFLEKEVEASLTQGGKTEVSKRPLPEGSWLPPAAAAEYVRQRMAAGAEKVVVRTIEPVGGMDPFAALKPVTIERSDFKKTEFDFGGKKVPATQCITVSSSQPTAKSDEIVDDQGIPLSSTVSMGPMKIMTRATEKKEATAPHKGPELMVSTFVTPDRPIANARQLNSAAYTLSVPEGKIASLPNTGSQKVESVNDTTLRVTVDGTWPNPAAAEDSTNAAFTTCSATLDCKDSRIKELVAKATANAGADKTARAKAIREFVYSYISKKDLDVGFANATEVARTRQGDCTEHGVLVAALLRADGIPSRVAAGLIYADQFAGGKDIFAYHMWAQGLLEVNGKPTWVDLDGTLPAGRTFDATHIALIVSPLSDGDTQDSFVTLATLLGRLSIRVEKTE